MYQIKQWDNFGDEFYDALKLCLAEFDDYLFIEYIKQLAAADSADNRKRFAEFIRAEVYKTAILTDNAEMWENAYSGYLSLITDALDIYPIADKIQSLNCAFYSRYLRPNSLNGSCLELLRINNFNVQQLGCPLDQILHEELDAEEMTEKIESICKQHAIECKEKNCRLFIMDLTELYDDEYSVISLFKAFRTYCPECKVMALQGRKEYNFFNDCDVVHKYKKILEILQSVIKESGRTEQILIEPPEDDYLIKDGELIKWFVQTEKIVIPDSVEIIGYDPFENKEMLTEIEIPDSVTIIKDNAFYNCDELNSISIPDSVIEIEENAFCHCTSLKHLKLPKSLKIIPDGMLMNCRNLKEIEISETVEEIKSRAFWEDIALENIKLPDSLKKIGKKAFFRCRGLKEITIPASVEEIGENAFFDCTNLKKITFLGKKPKLEPGALNVYSKTIEIVEFVGKRPKNLSGLPFNAKIVEIEAENLDTI